MPIKTIQQRHAELGRIRLGAAGALFTGLALSAIAPQLGSGMEIVQSLGLALFVGLVITFGPLLMALGSN